MTELNAKTDSKQASAQLPQPPQQPPQQVDITIVGGAMAGASLALGLAKLSEKLSAKHAGLLNRPLSIALIEAQKTDDNHPGFDSRSIAIAHGSVFELTQLGIWPSIASLGSDIENIHISDRGHFGMTELNAEQFGLPSMGQVVELAKVGKVLFDQLQQADIKLHCPASLTQLETDMDGHTITLDNGQQIRSKLLVAADGAHSKVRQALKQDVTQVEFEQVALVANVQTDKPHNSWAYERFTDTGPLALLPMAPINGKTRLSLVWALDAEQAHQFKHCDKVDFLAALQQAFGNRAGRFTDVGLRVSYPLTLSYMPRPIYHRTVFIGNAAQTLHPIAGQGFNLGLRDVVGLIDAVETSIETSIKSSIDTSIEAGIESLDLGHNSLIHHYLASRQQDRMATINNVEFLVRGFSNQYWPLVAGRSLGLRLLSWCPPLKAPIAHKAMGWKSV
ncbi:2-octaprenyl-6-methoxyphenyl hydroxylase [Shewanella sp. 6_MG-2023]|uniref:2-octaprenyl-6-methoxyphenyl hydroxylase n=1 Tax=Shewanella sp. 6_MG-2023 TaxID=3062660 RepID=UPI0026E495C9|nr:2-octaprenyl-6-methoxyphenyl hydroxylase [Shewanella sp. 6_MG-2023]MDO6619774.1 2-octaprenyl-6-methoxyphenyl hydroxylase [Shewanella sp. 6_MG-2023]